MKIHELDLIMSYEEPSYNVHPLLDINKLYQAAKAAEKNSAWKPEVQRFMFDWYSNVLKLKKELDDKKYKTSPPRNHIINERGRVRYITSRHVRDRVIRHVLSDEIIRPAIQPYLIYDNCASQKRRGLNLQRKRLEVHLHQYYRKHHSNNGYILLIDFQGFYDNINHSIAKDQLKSFLSIDDELSKWLIDLVIDDFRTPMSKDNVDYYMCHPYKAYDYQITSVNDPQTDTFLLHKGIDIGDQISQDIGILYPYRIDNYIKIVRGQKWYGRYMDDLYVISDSKIELRTLLQEITKIAKTIGIYIHPTKTRIEKLSSFRFCKIKYSLKKDGRLSKHISPERITGMRRKLKKLHTILDQNTKSICYADISNMFSSWFFGYKHYLTNNQKESLLKLYYTLYAGWVEEDKDNGRKIYNYICKWL